MPLILFFPVIFTGKALYWGTPILQFIPWRYIAWEMIKQGQIPLWNPYVGMGAPLLANYQLAIFYPPNWLLFILMTIGDVGWLAWGHGLVVVFHLAWAGLGMASLCRKLGINQLGQIVSGLAFGLSGYLVGRASFFSINSAVAWLPWIILFCLQNDYENPSRIVDRKTLILVFMIAMQFLAGHAQTCWYTILLVIILSGYWGWIRSDKKQNRIYYGLNEGNIYLPRFEYLIKFTSIINKWGRITIAYILACALTSIQVMPTLEYLFESQRSAAVDINFAMTYSFWPWRFLTLVAPTLFGSPVTGDYWGYGNFWEDHLYLGLLPLLLGLGSFFIRKENQTGIKPEQQILKYFSLRWVLLVLIILSFVLALGDNTPIYPWFYKNVFMFNLFQAPTRISIWIEFSLALLAGYSVTYWKKPEGRILYWARLATAGAFAITLGAGLAWFFMGDIGPTFIKALAKTGLLGIICGFFWLSLPDSLNKNSIGNDNKSLLKNHLWSWGVIIFVSFDLLLASWGLNPGYNQEIYRWKSSNAAHLREILRQNRVYLPAEDEYELKYKQHFRFSSFDIEKDLRLLRLQMLPNLNLFDHILSVNNFDPLVPTRYDHWMATLDKIEKESNDDRFYRLLNLSGIGVVEKKDDTADNGVRFEQVEGSKRVRWVPCAYPVDSADDAFHQVIDKNNDFDHWVVIEGLKISDIPACSHPPIKLSYTTRIEIISERPNSLLLKVNSPLDGWVILSDVWYPGWIANVDNMRVDIFRANYLFRAVHITKGNHVIQFTYAPISFYCGAVISFITIMASIVLWKKAS